MARATGQSTKFGAFFDSSIEVLSEANEEDQSKGSKELLLVVLVRARLRSRGAGREERRQHGRVTSLLCENKIIKSTTDNYIQ